ncbi:MAG: phospholipase D family protein [Burkholderiales bacterium]|nr:phospholipase D family protein [Burkholderiales bacterium]
MLHRLLLIVFGALIAGCASLPPRDPPAPSYAPADTSTTRLAKIAQASRPAGETAPSGFRLLPTGESAFNARAALMRKAERTLDLQYYHIHRDGAGRALLRELRDAAQRGVRVRLLVDDFYVGEIDDLLVGLAATRNVEVRLFNPLPLRFGPPLARLLLSPGDFERYNHRMHNKLFIADNAVAVYGGRNVADEYFMGNPEQNFIDMDLLSTGAVVGDLSKAFDSYWNSNAVWPIAQLASRPFDDADARRRFDEAVRDAPGLRIVPPDPLQQTPVEAQLDAGRLSQTFAEARVFADSPTKIARPTQGTEPSEAMSGMLGVMGGAREEVIIVSPYFLPSTVGMQMMRAANLLGRRTVVFTNSLASTDEPMVHDKYIGYRAEMLRLGVQLYEMDPALTRATRHFGDFGRSMPRLHAKVTVVDRRWVLVGSVNLDGRSALYNTEMSVAIDSPKLAQDMGRLMSLGTMTKLQLAADGESIERVNVDANGQRKVTTQEPAASTCVRLQPDAGRARDDHRRHLGGQPMPVLRGGARRDPAGVREKPARRRPDRRQPPQGRHHAAPAGDAGLCDEGVEPVPPRRRRRFRGAASARVQ